MLTTKKLVLWSVTGMIVLGVTVGGDTHAIFTSSASNTNNNYTAGTINLNAERDTGDTVPGPMFYPSTSDPTGLYPWDRATGNEPPGAESIGGWAPGDTAYRAMNLYNRGSLVAKVTKLKAEVRSPGVTEGAAYDQFVNKMKIKVTYSGNGQILYDGPLGGLLNGWVTIPKISIAPSPSGATNISFVATLDKSAGNEIQGKKFVFDFSFYAEQQKNNY